MDYSRDILNHTNQVHSTREEHQNFVKQLPGTIDVNPDAEGLASALWNGLDSIVKLLRYASSVAQSKRLPLFLL